MNDATQANDATDGIDSHRDWGTGKQRLSPRWDLRAEFAARFVRRKLKVLDVGCGAMAVERHFEPSAYLPADIVARDHRTRLVDLNKATLPAAWLEEAQLVVMLGVLEYLDAPFDHLRTVAGAGRPLLCSYNPADFHERESRRRNSWRTHYDIVEFEAGARSAGFAIAWRYIYEGNQVLWLLVPPGLDVHTVSTVARPLQAPAGGRRRQGVAAGRPTLMLAAFLGRGNCGDEAIFQVVHETFAGDFDIVACVDEFGAYQGFWDWYPYTRSTIVHQGDLSALYRYPDLAGLLVGGGGLPPAFVAGQVVNARVLEVPCAAAGIDVGLRTLGRPASAAYLRHLELFDVLAPRSALDVKTARTLGLDPFYGADWALRLVTDAATDLAVTPRHVALVLREFPLERVSYAYIEALERLVAGLAAMGRAPFFLPFCPEDERFLGELGLGRLAPLERHWWNPRRMKQIVATCGAVLSVGRLHSLVFAAATRTPVLDIAPPLGQKGTGGIFNKLSNMTLELGVDRADTVDEALQRLAGGAVRPTDEARLRAAEARLDGMIDRLRRLFAVAA